MPILYDLSEPGCLFTVQFGTLALVLTYLSFVQEINPSFDVFNMFIVINGIQYKNLSGFPLKTTHFYVLIYIVRLTAGFSFKEFAPPPPPKKLV